MLSRRSGSISYVNVNHITRKISVHAGMWAGMRDTLPNMADLAPLPPAPPPTPVMGRPDEVLPAPSQPYEGPSLVVFSGGTAFNSIAGDRSCHQTPYLPARCMSASTCPMTYSVEVGQG